MNIKLMILLIIIGIFVVGTQMIVGAFFFISIGITHITLFITKKQKEIKNELAKIDKIHMVKIKNIHSIYDNVKEEMNESGHFKMMVEIEGTIKSGSYSKNELYVQDVSGKILVKTSNISWYNNMGKPFKPLTPNITIPNDINVYLVGEVCDDFEGLSIRKPKNPDDPFIIACTSKQKYIQARQHIAKHIPRIGIVLILFGLLFLTPVNSKQTKDKDSIPKRIQNTDSILENKNIILE